MSFESKKKLIHVGIILDGNRRYAKKRLLEPWQGHLDGSKKLKDLLSWSYDLGINELTLYAFSIKNFNRSNMEVNFLMNLFEQELKKLLFEKEIHNKKVKINFLGRIDMFPENLKKIMFELMDKTKNYKDYNLNFAMAYDGRLEIVDSVKKILNDFSNHKIKIDDVNEELIFKNLYLSSEPDLIIRTSGEKRLSGFLLWQGSYSELYFVDKFWPEFNKQDLIDAIEEFYTRNRRFGK